ncbi:MAG: hypothetical protein ABGY96_01615 [bacterium]
MTATMIVDTSTDHLYNLIVFPFAKTGFNVVGDIGGINDTGVFFG